MCTALDPVSPMMTDVSDFYMETVLEFLAIQSIKLQKLSSKE